MNKKILILIITIAIIALFILLIFVINPILSEKYIRGEIEKANYCNTKDDCINVGSKCPFGCSIYVNKNEASRIRNLINSFESGCIYECIEPLGAECKNNKCEPISK